MSFMVGPPPPPSSGASQANLEHWWKLDEESGTRNDSVGTFHLARGGNGYDGFTTGKIGNASKSYPGSAGQVGFNWAAIPASDHLEMGDVAFTQSCWFRMNVWYTNTGQTGTLTKQGLWTGSTDTGVIQWAVSRLSDSMTFTVEATISAATWHHVVVTHDPDANELKMYLDGSLEETTAMETGIASAAGGNYTIGAYYNGLAGTGDNDMDLVSTWSRVFNQADVDYHYNSGSGRSLADTLTL